MSKILKATFFEDGFQEDNGEKLDMPSRIRQAVAELFEGFVMTKTHSYTPDPSNPTYVFGIYKARVETLTTGGEKFIVAFVPNDKVPLGSQRLLSSLKWTNFQSRETNNMKKEFNQLQLEPQLYKRPNVSLLNDIINYSKPTSTSYLYKCNNLPLRVELIPSKKDETFAERGTVATALDLFTTSITIQ